MSKTLFNQNTEIVRKPSKTALAKILGISRTMLYYRHKRPVLDEEIKRQIEAVLVVHKAYGHKRIALELKMNKKRILRVMKHFNIKPYRRRAKQLVKKEDLGKVAEEETVNVYKLLCSLAPNIVWVSDFTYIKFMCRFIYVATIMDIYTREIIGVEVSRFHNQNLVMDAFMNAENKAKVHPLFLHSDQGSEYTSEAYKRYVMSKGITISYAEKSSPWQNGFQESFYQGFKLDLGEANQFETLGELVDAIHQTLYYYNNLRIHTTLKTNPVAFKTAFLYSKDKLFKKMGT